MKTSQNQLLSFLLIIAILLGIFYFMMPQTIEKSENSLDKFSTKRALEKVKTISQNPHYVGSKNHEVVAHYLVNELKELGLSPEIQEGYTFSEGGTLVKAKNIVGKIKGSQPGKALLLLSHYDSAPHSKSKGASDDASGIATILESVRAFNHQNIKPKNDIIILFSDAEEIGLNGAALFVTQHNWAKDVGLVLNFEARGSSGPSYMLLETNKGNSKMIQEFSKSNPEFPVSNSLMYSIYKMLPNDTDLTVFRVKGDIQGFNFAFIDNHFNYHTERDNYDNLSPKTIAHQGSYLLPMLSYFSQADLTNLNSEEDNAYFNIPFAFVHYPFSWIIPVVIIGFLLLLGFTFIGMGKHLFRIDEVLKSFIPMLVAIILCGGITYIGWKILNNIYPQYQDILHGFTYNGHDYIYAFVSLSLSICFLVYAFTNQKKNKTHYVVAPLFLWLIINVLIAIYLKGAGFLIIPVISSTLMLGIYVITQKQNTIAYCLLSIPTLVIVAPFIQMFPIGLGLKILFGSAILTALTFGLLLPIFGNFNKKGIWSILFLLVSIGFFAKAHQNSFYTSETPKPNSLLYYKDVDSQKSYWTTYDVNLDEWTKNYLGENPKPADVLNNNKIYSKYGSKFTYLKEAPNKDIALPTIEFLKDTVQGSNHFYTIKITPNRSVNRYDIFNKNNSAIGNLVANGAKPILFKSKIGGNSNHKILSYYVVNQEPLVLEFSINKNESLNLELMESSFDLLTHNQFTVSPRKSWMIPTPFVLNDAIVIRQKIKPTLVQEDNPIPQHYKRNTVLRDSVNIQTDSLR